MINYHRFTLNNGLRVIFHQDKSTPIVCVNTLYDVGSKDESPERTGFAHLFEHLMFGGSINIPSYDEPLQRVGGQNNAFTSVDITNYYLTVPAANIETGLWLESDRMLSLAFTEKSLEVQRNVVVEEFKQNYLNQPYGDVWLLLRPLAYKAHPYRWATIGEKVEHIQDATMEEVKAFFNKHYSPQNAILTIAGNLELEEVKKLVKKWFEPIPNGNKYLRELPQEPEQHEARILSVEREVPQSAIYLAYPMCARMDKDFYTADLLSDILSRGNSSRFYKSLVKKKKLFSSVSAYVTGDIEIGLFVISGRINPEVSMEEAEAGIQSCIEELIKEAVSQEEFNKLINKVETSQTFSQMDISNKAFALAYFELLGDIDRVNNEMEFYQQVTPQEIQAYANSLFNPNKVSKLYYNKKEN
jgi:zinc protease